MANLSDHTTRVADSLLQIEIELRRIDAWESEPPSPEALQSAQPFAVDTLEFTQWLQFQKRTERKLGFPRPEMHCTHPHTA